MRVLHRSILTASQRDTIRVGLARAGATTHERISNGYANVSPKRRVRATIERALRGRFSGRQWRMLRKELFLKAAQA